jgi:hypothetical protein
MYRVGLFRQKQQAFRQKSCSSGPSNTLLPLPLPPLPPPPPLLLLLLLLQAVCRHC